LRRSPSLLPLAVLLLAGYCSLSFVTCPSARGPARGTRLVLQAKDDGVVDVEVVALSKLEQDIEKRIAEAEKEEKPGRVRDLARLLVLTRTSATAAAWQATTELRETVSTSIADSLREFVGKEDYDINDVAAKVESKVASAVEGLDNVYLTSASAEKAPDGSKPIVIQEIVGPVAGQIKEGTKEALVAFTGKEDYKFGDISKEAATRAHAAISNLVESDEYKELSDKTKEAMSKAKDAAKDALTNFTGKEDYKFGDVTKTVLRNVLNWMEKDDDKRADKK